VIANLYIPDQGARGNSWSYASSSAIRLAMLAACIDVPKEPKATPIPRYQQPNKPSKKPTPKVALESVKRRKRR
jgi:hypothetical protein